MSFNGHQKEAALSYEQANDFFKIIDGQLYWRKKRGNRTRTDQPAGTEINGYRQIGIKLNGKVIVFYAHRIAYLLYHRHWPENQVDHINRNREDNAKENLRDVTDADNKKNMSLRNDNMSGNSGVCWHKGAKKWMVQICVDGKPIYGGLFRDKERAFKKAKQMHRENGFHENHGVTTALGL